MIGQFSTTIPKRKLLAITALLFIAVMALYAPALKHPFITLDDNQYVTFKAHTRAGLSPGSPIWPIAKFMVLTPLAIIS